MRAKRQDMESFDSITLHDGKASAFSRMAPKGGQRLRPSPKRLSSAFLFSLYVDGQALALALLV
ncbi:hypothetical protein D4T97_011270 [Siminovitchia acidinfaciens]|uniref:Uncharacterized protein n=1 Tax=Siminovitchia acidinfaciens TaxID=2321395 RepID=A0A429XZM9_9BACI|nr:hypothetical protein [Siminovitchia acidinfaciens]RST74246.1 hypothetical protein D4T97_011270 [Siminovitchia acidinfaciens]